jgi:hypothetical protein
MTEIKFFNLTFRYIDDVLSINNFDSWIPILYPVKLEIKEKTEHPPLSHCLTFTSNLTPMVNFRSDFITKESTSILPL